MANLIISKNTKQALSQNQLAFNKLTAKIEKLRSEIKKKELQFDKAISIYSSSIHPLRIELGLQNRKALDVLWPIYKSKKLSLPHQKLFKEVLQHLLDEFFNYRQNDDEPDNFIKGVFRELEGISYDKAKKEEDDDIKDDMQSMFDDIGIDIDLSSFDMNDEKSFAEKIAEAKQKFTERDETHEHYTHQHKKRHTKKTTKQLEKEKLQLAIDEMKQKNISTIYKQLAKLFHPDLEQDEGRRAEKQLLMQELTAAYEAKNLHTLLLLEMKWIHKENDHLGTLTEEKLKIYLEILKEQAVELEREKHMLIQKPQYAVLVEEFGYQIALQPIATLEHEVADMKRHINILKKDIEDFESKEHLKHVKTMLREWKARIRDEDDEMELMNMFLKQYR